MYRFSYIISLYILAAYILYQSAGGVCFLSVDFTGNIVDNTATQSRDIDLWNLSFFWLAESYKGGNLT